MRKTISSVGLIDAIIPDVNKDNTTVYLHEKLPLRKLNEQNPRLITAYFQSSYLDQVEIKYGMKHRMVIVPKDLNNQVDNLDANYPQQGEIKDAIVD